MAVTETFGGSAFPISGNCRTGGVLIADRNLSHGYESIVLDGKTNVNRFSEMCCADKKRIDKGKNLW